MSDIMVFGERIRLLRTECNITLRKFAEMIDVTPTYVSKIERGEAHPPAEAVIKRMAQVLKTDADDLITLAGKIPSDLPAIIRQQPKEMAIMLRTAHTLSPEQLKEVLHSIQKKSEE
jgi:HTH-type transcriptional regulator, competence development regulator